MEKPYGLVVEFVIKPGHQEAFDELVAATLVDVRSQEPGTLIYTSHSVEAAPDRRVFYELYRDQAAFDTHEAMPHVRHFLAQREQHVADFDVSCLTLVDGKGVPAHQVG